MNVNLMSQKIDGKSYGVGRCAVNLGGSELDSVAVSAGGERWISTEADCVTWLAHHGMGRAQAEQFVRMGLKAWDESHSIGIA